MTGGNSSADTWDVVIVGAGGAGLAAAIEAARAGASVLVLEKHERVGGSTAWSVGSYTCSGTAHQARVGISDCPQHHFEDMGLFNAGKGDTDNLELRRILVDGAPQTLRWLTDLGIEFVGPNPEPPHRVPRMHNVVPSSASFPYHLRRECERLGVEIRCGLRVVDLVLERERVAGVQAEDSSGARSVLRAGRGVILATGDFAGGRELKARFFGPEVVDAAPVNPLSTGDGIALAERYGASILNGGHTTAPKMRFVPAAPTWIHRLPPKRWIARGIKLAWQWMPAKVLRPFVMKFVTTALAPEGTLFRCGAILVDPNGDRIPVDMKNIALHLPLTPQNLGFIVFDSSCAVQLEQWPNFVSTAPGVAYAYLRDYKAARKDIYFEAGSLDELARRIRTDPARLAASMAGANPAAPAAPGKAPFYALGPVRGYVTMTEGGVAVNARLQVLGRGGEPIPRLYAAGSTGQGGLLLEGHGHHLGWAFVSGRLAGRSVLQEAPLFPASASQ